ncbi:hypothetical protein PRIPAC_79139 [Pristionchus pacificus]|nr:hypothetical protein PRIPAC_79139 [Pristionchus pacificus]
MNGYRTPPTSHVFVDGLYINVIFGPVLHILPRPLADAVYFMGLLLNTGWWQLTPAPCIMQYLHLFNGLHKRGRAMSTLESLVSSYAFSILLMSFTAIWAVDMLPTPEFEETMITAVRSAYNLTERDQFLVYGLSVEMDPLNKGRSLKDIAFIAFLPTYAAAYSAFFIVIHRSEEL